MVGVNFKFLTHPQKVLFNGVGGAKPQLNQQCLETA